ncbi:MAG: DUF4139 domain-containing protein [Candidatus Hydrothermarchaeota archaeon]
MKKFIILRKCIILMVISLLMTLSLPSPSNSLTSLSPENTIKTEIPVQKVTFYQNGLIYVERIKNILLKKGINEIVTDTFSDQILAYTIRAKTEEGEVIDVSYTPEKKLETRFKEFLGKQVEILLKEGKIIRGELVSYSLDYLGIYSENRLDVVKTENILSITVFGVEKNGKALKIKIDSKKDGNQKIKFTYLTKGGNWKPVYDLYVEKSHLISNAVITNEVEPYSNVELELVAGTPHFAFVPVPIPAMAKGYAVEEAGRVVRGGLGEYVVYKLSNVTIEKNEIKKFKLFEGSVDIDPIYQWDASTLIKGKASERLKLKNNMEDPWASGIMNIYRNDKLIGSDSIEYTPIGADVEVTVGSTPDIDVKKELTAVKVSYEETLRIETVEYTLTINNYKKESIAIIVKDRIPYGSTLVSANPKATQKPDNMLEWRINIRPQGEQKITYTYETRQPVPRYVGKPVG